MDDDHNGMLFIIETKNEFRLTGFYAYCLHIMRKLCHYVRGNGLTLHQCSILFFLRHCIMNECLIKTKNELK